MDYLSESVHLKVNLMVFFSMKEIKNFLLDSLNWYGRETADWFKEIILLGVQDTCIFL